MEKIKIFKKEGETMPQFEERINRWLADMGKAPGFEITARFFHPYGINMGDYLSVCFCYKTTESTPSSG